jgi:type I restriction enzyme R subunit
MAQLHRSRPIPADLQPVEFRQKTQRDHNPPVNDVGTDIRLLLRAPVDQYLLPVNLDAHALPAAVDQYGPAAAGLKKPDISILSDEFLAEVQNMPQRNLAVELLRKLLNDEIKARSRKYLVQSRLFSEMLERSLRAYHNRTIEAAQVIEELINLARDMREAKNRGHKLNLTDEELAFYDALEVNDSAVKVLGDQVLRTIAQELVKTVRNNVTIDWTIRENVRAKLRTMVKRVLRKYGYPPDKQESTTNTVIKQAETLCLDLV